MSETYHHGDLKNALIQAGLEILSKEGVEALSLRKVSRKVGVSHAAPYAHFQDKQALIAAIATEGYKKLYQQVSAAQHDQADPLQRLIATTWAYIQFALNEPDHFKITFSGVVEKEQDHPEYVEQSKKNFALVVEVVEYGQRGGILPPDDPQLLAVSIWSSLHGLIHLLLGNQLPTALLSRYSVREMMLFHLQRFVLVALA